jgi:hypothetical protein
MTQRFLLIAVPVFLVMTFPFCGNSDTANVSQSTIDITDSTFNPTGAIAYIRNDAEIRLINPDGTNDRRIWTHPDAKSPMGIFELAWRPDGRELAFSSAHGALFSVYHADIYSIRPDGSGFRKITNAPDHKDFSRYKKGTVTVTVRNNQYAFQQAQSSVGVLIINVIGAAEPQHITLPPGSSKTLVFKDVADFGNHAQAIVAMSGSIRWLMPGTDVKAGADTKAPDFIISGDGVEMFGAFRPTWKQDGSEISYRSGHCIVSRVPRNPPPGEMNFNPLFGGEHPQGTCVWDLGPTPELKDQVIYSENSGEEGAGIFQIKEAGVHPGTRLTFFSELQLQVPPDLQWLPDGSGFLYSTIRIEYDASNIFHYNIRTKQKTQITKLENEFARRFSISPDGQWIVYEKSNTWDEYEKVDLWKIKIDGSEDRLLVINGLDPCWSK